MADSEGELHEDSSDGDYDTASKALNKGPKSPKAEQLSPSSALRFPPYLSSQARSGPEKKRRIVGENKGPLQYWTPQQKTFIFEVSGITILIGCLLSRIFLEMENSNLQWQRVCPPAERPGHQRGDVG
jgi:hypothetical protein